MKKKEIFSQSQADGNAENISRNSYVAVKGRNVIRQTLVLCFKSLTS